jgi:capsid portal protein
MSAEAEEKAIAIIAQKIASSFPGVSRHLVVVASIYTNSVARSLTQFQSQ